MANSTLRPRHHAIVLDQDLSRRLDLLCASTGKGGYIWKIDNDLVYIVLNCGHPITLPLGELQQAVSALMPTACPACGGWVLEGNCYSPKCMIKKEPTPAPVIPRMRTRSRKMRRNEPNAIEPAQTTVETGETTSGVFVNNIPAKGGAIPISGMEKVVEEFLIKHAYLALLEAEVEEMKIQFRRQAADLWENADADMKPKEYRFIGDTGRAVSVAMPDESADSSRKVVTDALIKSVLRLGIDAHELGLLEIEESVVLSGEWLPMIRAIVKQYYTDRGTEVPAGLTEKASRKLVDGAFDKLRALRDGAQSDKEREAYATLLDGGKRTATVRAG